MKRELHLMPAKKTDYTYFIYLDGKRISDAKEANSDLVIDVAKKLEVSEVNYFGSVMPIESFLDFDAERARIQAILTI